MLISRSLASGLFFLFGSVVNVGLAVYTLSKLYDHDADDDSDDDEYYYDLPYRLLSCVAAGSYLLDVALDDDRRSRIVAVFFGVGAALELLSTILISDWIMLVAVHSYLVSAALIMSQPPESPLEGMGDCIFAMGCALDVGLSYLYWNENYADVLDWGDLLSATLWFVNAIFVLFTFFHCDCCSSVGSIDDISDDPLLLGEEDSDIEELSSHYELS